jgi:hypothetical protein
VGCGCGKKTKYEVVTADGSKQVVETLTAAMTLVRNRGGHYTRIKA